MFPKCVSVIGSIVAEFCARDTFFVFAFAWLSIVGPLHIVEYIVGASHSIVIAVDGV
jgi:hypothetical protein